MRYLILMLEKHILDTLRKRVLHMRANRAEILLVKINAVTITAYTRIYRANKPSAPTRQTFTIETGYFKKHIFKLITKSSGFYDPSCGNLHAYTALQKITYGRNRVLYRSADWLEQI